MLKTENAVKALKFWEEKYDDLIKNGYGKNEESVELDESFREYLENNGFINIGAGCCVRVHKHPNDDVVIKNNMAYGEFAHTFESIVSDYDKPWFLEYLVVSKDFYCAIQKYVDCSKEARRKAGREINKANPTNCNYSNMGLKDGEPVIIDD